MAAVMVDGDRNVHPQAAVRRRAAQLFADGPCIAEQAAQPADVQRDRRSPCASTRGEKSRASCM